MGGLEHASLMNIIFLSIAEVKKNMLKRNINMFEKLNAKRQR
jgi:hypothetical protein